MIPLLFAALLISKVVPVLFLKKWYDMKTVLASGFLLTSTLSLVIAATTIGERIGVIDGADLRRADSGRCHYMHHHTDRL
jgi:CPA2 family monovalent cation:H+ antiporter-2